MPQNPGVLAADHCLSAQTDCYEEFQCQIGRMNSQEAWPSGWPLNSTCIASHQQPSVLFDEYLKSQHSSEEPQEFNTVNKISRNTCTFICGIVSFSPTRVNDNQLILIAVKQWKTNLSMSYAKCYSLRDTSRN